MVFAYSQDFHNMNLEPTNAYYSKLTLNFVKELRITPLYSGLIIQYAAIDLKKNYLV